MSNPTNLRKPGFSLFTRLVRFALAIAICLTATGAIICQTKPDTDSKVQDKSEEPPDKESKAQFTLRITTDQIIGISLKAKDVRLKAIATELSGRLKIPVFVTPIMERHLVTTNFSDLVLEPAMQMLAPQVYIDYEIDSTPGTQPRPLGIYLHGYNERPPGDNAVVRGSSDVMVIEGNTEDGTESSKEAEAEAEPELKITHDKGELSVKSKKQPLVVVLYGIANELGIPLEVKNEVTDLVTVTISKTSVESTLQQLGPNIRLYVRADLQLGYRRPLRMVLVGPQKKS